MLLILAHQASTLQNIKEKAVADTVLGLLDRREKRKEKHPGKQLLEKAKRNAQFSKEKYDQKRGKQKEKKR